MPYGAIMKRVLVYGMTDNPGGIESYLLTVLDRIKEQDVQLDFVTDFPTIAYEEELKLAGSKIYYIPAKGKKLFKHWAGMKRILKAHTEYESVYFNLLDAGGVFTAIVAKMMKRKVVVHSHNGDTDKQRLHKICKPFLIKITDEYLACSNLAANYMFGEKVLGKKKVLIIPNAIDAKKFSYDEEKRLDVRKKLGVEDKFVVCHIGRISRQKNPYRLLDVFEELHKKDTSAVLLYVGDGDMSTEIHQDVEKRLDIITKEGYEPHIRMLGVRSDIPDIMQAADVFLLPSLYEGLPIVAIEAQTAGLPVVMSTNITKEVALCDKAEFVSLEEGNKVWAEKILSHKGEIRTSKEEAIREAGYDKNHMSKAVLKLMEVL